LVADPGAGCCHSVPVVRSLFPLHFEGLIQWDDLKSCFGEGLIYCFVDFRVGAGEIEPSDFDVFGERF
jgi:hypothetical protein